MFLFIFGSRRKREFSNAEFVGSNLIACKYSVRNFNQNPQISVQLSPKPQPFYRISPRGLSNLRNFLMGVASSGASVGGKVTFLMAEGAISFSVIYLLLPVTGEEGAV